MAYDSARHRVVLFGGYQDGTGNRLGDTWEWDGETWAEKATSGPSPRTHTAIAYDSTRNRVLLFGGVGRPGGYYTDNDDTWEWDGIAWQERIDPKPPHARNGHGMAYDSLRRKVIPGFPQPIDTWEWNGSDWQQVNSGGPAERGRAPVMTYDRFIGKVVLFGGQTLRNPDSGDTWLWSGPIYRCTTPAAGDINCDGVVDVDDRKLIDAARGRAACAADDSRDLDGDGRITIVDRKQLDVLCTFPDCARDASGNDVEEP